MKKIGKKLLSLLIAAAMTVCLVPAGGALAAETSQPESPSLLSASPDAYAPTPAPYADEEDSDILPGARINGLFTPIRDTAVYHFLATSDGTLDVSMSCVNAHPGSGVAVSGLVTGAESGEMFADFSLQAGEQVSNKSVGIGEGEYLITLKCLNYSQYAQEYLLLLDFTPSGMVETEQNDNITTADRLYLDRRCLGSINTPDDCDFYVADLSEVADPAIRFDGGWEGSWEITAFDGSGKQLAHGVCRGDETITLPVSGDGNCFVRVLPLEYSPDSYGITLTGTRKTAKSRLAGSDRISTAVEISHEGWESAESVIIANGFSFPDALAGVSLSGTLNAPILLTANKAEPEKAIMDEIERLRARNVYILGGNAAVNESIEAELSKSAQVVRLAGQNRYETAVKIAEKLGEISGKQPDNVFFACSQNFPDALSAGPAAALAASPILYVNTTGGFDDDTRLFVSKLATENAVILGGTAAISEEGEEDIRDYFSNAVRVAGKDRYETAANLYNRYKNSFTGKGMAIATGRSFPDALAGGALSARLHIPMILVGNTLGDTQKQILAEAGPERVYVFGGNAAVNEDVVNSIA